MRTLKESSALQKTQFIVPKRLNETQKINASQLKNIQNAEEL